MLQSLNTAKSSGHDGIFARMLKPTANVIASSITKLFNLSIQLGQPRTAWKSTNIVPIPKKQDAKGPNGPISLLPILPILSKILEKHFYHLISDYLSDHLSEHSPLSNCQRGFQPAKSTVFALLSTINDLFQQLEKGKENWIHFL